MLPNRQQLHELVDELPKSNLAAAASALEALAGREAPTKAGAPAVTVSPLNLKELERKTIEGALKATGGNRTQAAKQLGLALRTLQYRLKAYSAVRSDPVAPTDSAAAKAG